MKRTTIMRGNASKTLCLRRYCRSGSLRTLLFLTVAALVPAVALAADGRLTDDAYISAKLENRNFNFGKNAPLLVDATNTTFLKFDLSDLPLGTTSSNVSKAVLRLWVSKVTTAGSFDVKRVTGSWGEDSLTTSRQYSAGSIQHERLKLI